MRAVHQVDDRLEAVDVGVELSLADVQGRRRLEDEKSVAADLAVDATIAEEPHHQHLSEHRRMNAAERAIGNLETKLVRGLELDAGEEAKPTYVLDHRVAGESRPQAVPQRRTEPGRTRAEIVLLEDVERREAGAHGETVFAVGRGVDDGALERGVESRRPLARQRP